MTSSNNASDLMDIELDPENVNNDKIILTPNEELISKRQELLDSFFFRVENPRNFKTLVEELINKKEYDLAYQCAEMSYMRINTMDEERKKLDDRLNAIEKRLNLFQQKKPGTLTNEEKKEMNTLELEKFLFSQFPSHARMTCEQHQKIKLDVANIILAAVLEKRDQALKEVGLFSFTSNPRAQLDEEVKRILSACLKEITVPSHLLSLVETLDARHENVLAYSTLQKLIRDNQKLKIQFEKDLNLRIEMDVLMDEKKRLLKIKKSLPQPQQKRLDELSQKYKSGQLSTEASIFDPRNLTQYDDATAAKKMIDISVRHIQFLDKNNNETQKREIQNKVLKSHIDFLIEDLDDLEAPIKNPFVMLDFANSISLHNNTLVLQICNKIRARIEELQLENEERNLLLEERKKRLIERNKLFEQWQIEAPEDYERFLILETEYRYSNHLPSYFKRDYNDLFLSASKLMLDAIIPLQNSSEVDALLLEVDNPEHLCKLAYQAQSYKKRSDIVLKCGEKCQARIKAIDEDRIIRRPLQRQLDELKRELEELAVKHMHLSPEKVEKMKQLEEELNKLPKLPSYVNVYDIYQYDQLSLEIVQVMTNAILDSKFDLEEQIAEMFKKMDPKKIDHKKIEADRARINKQVTDLVGTCLEKFSNPNSLLQYATSMQKRGEMEIVLKVVSKCFERIKEISALQAQRAPLQEKLDLLNSEKEQLVKLQRQLEPEKEKEIQTLQTKLEALPLFPHFAKLFEYHQYDLVKLNLIKTEMNCILDVEKALDEKIRKIQFENPQNLDQKKNDEEYTKIRESKFLVVEHVKVNLENPHHLLEFLKELQSKNQTEPAMALASNFYEKLFKLEELRQKQENLEVHIKVLEEERQALKNRKRDLPSDQLSVLDSLNKQYKELKAPEFLPNSDSLDELTNNVTSILVEISLGSKNTTFIDQAYSLLHKYVSNPNFLLDFADSLTQKKEYDFALKLFSKTQERLNLLKNVRSGMDQIEKRITELQQERELLDRRRKELTKEQQQELRDSLAKNGTWKALPKYYQTLDNDNANLLLAKKLLDCLLAKRGPNSSENQETIAALEKSLQNIEKIENLIQLVQYLKSKKEYSLVIKAGIYAEDQIESIRKKLQAKEDLQKEIKEVEQNLLILTAQESKNPKEKQKLEKSLEKLRQKLNSLPEVKANFEALNSGTLELAEMVIDAAKIESMDDILKDQHILAFKIDTKQERWDDIRNLSSDDEWLKVKNELVGFIMKRETENVKQKIELLLKDELYDQVIQIFPDPSDDPDEIKLITDLWNTIEKSNSSKLKDVVPLVLRYIKRYFQQFKFEEVDTILDQIQRQYSSLMCQLFSQACDMVLLNILPSQYSTFVGALRKFKKRMISLARSQDWDAFFEDFKKKHKGKKRLIQMINLVGDSAWDLKLLMEHKSGSKVKTEKTQTSTTNPDNNNNNVINPAEPKASKKRKKPEAPSKSSKASKKQKGYKSAMAQPISDEEEEKKMEEEKEVEVEEEKEESAEKMDEN